MAALVGFAVLVLGVYAAVASGLLVFGLAGIVAAVVAYALLKSYSELVTIIADMMLPK